METRTESQLFLGQSYTFILFIDLLEIVTQIFQFFIVNISIDFERMEKEVILRKKVRQKKE